MSLRSLSTLGVFGYLVALLVVVALPVQAQNQFKFEPSDPIFSGPEQEGSCNVNRVCDNGPNVSCTSPSGVCSSGPSSYGWVECDGDRTYCQAPCVAPPSGLQGWWSLDDSSSSSVADNLASGSNGTYYGATYVSAGKVSHARSFGGDNDHVRVPDHSAIDIGTADLTIDAWVKTTAGSGIKVIVDKRKSSYPYTGYVFFLSSGRLGFQLGDSGGYTNYGAGSSSPNIADGQWHLVAVTVDRNVSSGLRWYVDGVEVGSRKTTTGRSGSLANSEPLYIGRRYDNSASASWNGQIDEVEIFNRVLSASEIAGLYNAGSNGKCKDACTTAPTLSTTLQCISMIGGGPNHYCIANPTGGCGIYSYQWTWTGGGSMSPQGSNANVSLCNNNGVITVTVTDQGGHSTSASRPLDCGDN